MSSLSGRRDLHRNENADAWSPWIDWPRHDASQTACRSRRLWSLGEQRAGTMAKRLPNTPGRGYLSFMLGLAASALELSAFRSPMSFSIEARSLSNSAGSGTATVAAAGLS